MPATAVSRRLAVPGRRDSWAQTVCLACVETLEHADAAILALRGGSRSEGVLGASDPWAARLAELPYSVGEGPGVEAFGTGSPVLVSDLSVEQVRWPGFADAALAVGAAAVFAFPLRFGAIKFGTLELLRRRLGGLPSAQLQITLDDAFARLRAHAFGLDRSVRDVAQDVLERRISLDELAE
jgi:hypothetical protein